MWSIRGIAHELIVQIGNCGQDCAILEVSLIAINSLTLRALFFGEGQQTYLSISNVVKESVKINDLPTENQYTDWKNTRYE